MHDLAGVVCINQAVVSPMNNEGYCDPPKWATIFEGDFFSSLFSLFFLPSHRRNTFTSLLSLDALGGSGIGTGTGMGRGAGKGMGRGKTWLCLFRVSKSVKQVGNN